MTAYLANSLTASLSRSPRVRALAAVAAFFVAGVTLENALLGVGAMTGTPVTRYVLTVFMIVM